MAQTRKQSRKVDIVLCGYTNKYLSEMPFLGKKINILKIHGKQRPNVDKIQNQYVRYFR
jgi:hypothetical protein